METQRNMSWFRQVAPWRGGGISNHSFSFYFKLNRDSFPGRVIRAQAPLSGFISCGKRRGVLAASWEGRWTVSSESGAVTTDSEPSASV